MRAFKVKISGRVTGVGYRFHALSAARGIPGLAGYVRNIAYGEVEAVIQGDDEAVDAITAVLREGPPLARVDSLLINEIPVVPGLQEFTVK